MLAFVALRSESAVNGCWDASVRTGTSSRVEDKSGSILV